MTEGENQAEMSQLRYKLVLVQLTLYVNFFPSWLFLTIWYEVHAYVLLEFVMYSA